MVCYGQDWPCRQFPNDFNLTGRTGHPPRAVLEAPDDRPAATVAADAIGDLVERADHRPAMPAAPLILAVASQRVVGVACYCLLEPIREVWIHGEAFAASRLSMMRIMARRMNAATVVA